MWEQLTINGQSFSVDLVTPGVGSELLIDRDKLTAPWAILASPVFLRILFMPKLNVWKTMRAWVICWHRP